MLGIVVSRADSASVHIGDQLRAVADWEQFTDESGPDAGGGGTVYRTDGAVIREFEEWHLHLDRPAAIFDDPDLLVFASRHSGETGPLLTAHHTGNFGPADHGGEPNALARACPNAHDAVLDALREHAPERYEVGMECTHHGPTTVGAPSMFVEVGSAQAQWDDPEACRAVAKAILDLRDVSSDQPAGDGSTVDSDRRHLVGFGGGHYTPRFERIVRETGWSVGHIAADWGLDAIEDDRDRPAVIEEAFQQSAAAYGLVEGDKPRLTEIIEEYGYRAVTETWVRETDGVDLDLVEAIEDELGQIEEGVRFGDRVPSHEGTDFEVTSLPAELVDEASGIDREAASDRIAARTLAFQTEEGGTRPTETVVLADDAERAAIIDDLVEILAERYDEIHRKDGRIVARTEQFDPEKAKTFGLSEGPAFGRLASGEAVEVDGRTIPPEKVQTEREVSFEL
ncbi:D-aminoacyl-tRNA deacylase [Halovenus sp. HT40]|uniref:D-aminoacyl-tRNA deacylase n=1 Tax=Halovenus sp. HT40 TaxID=3126691 RepID=UPI00300F54A2